MKRIFPLLAGALLLLGPAASAQNLTGRVLGDGQPLPGVPVSDGRQIVTTDAEGRYAMTSDKSLGTVFVITPSGYIATSRDGIQPDFYAHLTEPADRPEAHDFTLRSEDQSHYGVLLVADMHLTSDKKFDDLRRFHDLCMPVVRRAAEKLRAEGPVYSFNLGDLAFDKYWVVDKFTLEDAYAVLQREGWPVPLYSVPGNHDNDGRVATEHTDFDAGWLYRKVLGPEHYALDIGGDHWIVMDDILYDNNPRKGKKHADGMAGQRDYRKGFTEAGMAFLRADLARQPDGKRIFLCTHCPLLTCLSDTEIRFDDPEQMREVDSLFARFGSVRVFAGHTHQTEWMESEAWPHVKDLNVGGLSGNAWSTDPMPYGKFGCSAGVVLARFAPGRADYTFDSVEGEDDCFRVYDMNEAAAYYASEPSAAEMAEKIPDTVNYAEGDFRNVLYINDWFLRPGETVEVLETRGLFRRKVKLPVARVQERDPYFDLSFFIRGGSVRSSYNAERVGDICPHLFSVRTRKPDSEVTIRVLDAEGKRVREATVRRPVAFNPAQLLEH